MAGHRGDGAAHGWARLLDPRREVVGFAGREAELAALVAWCLDESVGRLRLVTGLGGVGKTRLAVELARRMTGSGWRCERVADGHEGEVIAALRAVTRERALLMVDYAETRVGLPDLLSALAGAQGEGLRVLLLARSAGDWWEQLGVGQPQVWDLMQAAKSTELPLSPVVAADLSDAEVIALAVSAFAQELDLPEKTVEIDDSGYPGRRRMLDLHAAALVAVLAEESTATVRVDLGRFWVSCCGMRCISGTTARGPRADRRPGRPVRRLCSGRWSPLVACWVPRPKTRHGNCPPECPGSRCQPMLPGGCGSCIRQLRVNLTG